MSANTLYRASPLEAFIDNVAALCGFPHALGDYEQARLQSQRPPVIWRHPTDRYILEVVPVTDHRAELDIFADCQETLEMIVTGTDYAAARHTLVEIWRLAFDVPTITREGVQYLSDVEWGKVRRPRTNEVFPKSVPSSGFTLIDLVTLTWGAPRQAESAATVESVSATGKMYEGTTLKGTIGAPIP
jgi:hypothetical protein